jgi:hypothetical protein
MAVCCVSILMGKIDEPRVRPFIIYHVYFICYSCPSVVICKQQRTPMLLVTLPPSLLLPHSHTHTHTFTHTHTEINNITKLRAIVVQLTLCRRSLQAHFSRCFTPQEQKYSVPDQEMMAIKEPPLLVIHDRSKDNHAQLFNHDGINKFAYFPAIVSPAHKTNPPHIILHRSDHFTILRPSLPNTFDLLTAYVTR